jgi:hypothetical protein
LPALEGLDTVDRDAADVITGSEHILKAYADKHSLTATAIVDLIKCFLKNPEFNAYDVDTDMLQRLQAAMDTQYRHEYRTRYCVRYRVRYWIRYIKSDIQSCRLI